MSIPNRPPQGNCENGTTARAPHDLSVTGRRQTTPDCDDRDDCSSRQDRYVRRVLELYCLTPGTFLRVRSADRRLARSFYERQIPLETIHTALLFAVARRSNRPTDAEPLAPIASLHYFQPIIREFLNVELPSAYLEHFRQQLADIAPALTAYNTDT